MAEKEEFKLEEYSDIKQSMYIEASAGTGKTYTITGIVSKLVKEKIPLEKILIVTYTEKAVGELRNRIREKCPDSDVDNAAIYTIHSFCQKTLSEFSFTAKQCSELSLVSDSALDDFLERQIREKLKEDSLFEYLFKDAKKQDNFIDKIKDDFKAAINKYYLTKDGKENPDIISLNQKPDVKIHDKEFTYDELSKILHPQTLEDLFFIPDFESNYNKLQNSPATKLQEFAENIKEKTIEKNFFDFDGRSFQANRMPKDIPEALPLLNYFRDLKQSIKNLLEYYPAILYTENLKTLYYDWQKEKEANKLQSYNDMLREVHEAVCDETSNLRTKLRQKYQYAIIDEFQDTNQLQWDIFSKVFLQENDDSHTIIVVGDPKQSIYSFQGADVNVYKDAVNTIEEKHGHPYRLSKNWRSTDTMIEACNFIFENKQAPQTDTDDSKKASKKSSKKDTENKDTTIRFFSQESEIEFERSNTTSTKHVAQFNGQNIKPIWIAGTPDNKIDAKTFAETAVQQIIECCSFVDDKTKLQVFNKGANGNCQELRNVSFKDFAILARSSSEMKEIESAMQKAGIPFLRYKDKNLFAGIECMHWISLFNAISAKDFTGRNRRLLSEALFSSFFGVPLDKVEDKKFDNPSCEERQKIISWRQLAQQRKWAKLLEKIFSDTDLENKLSRLDKMQSLAKFRQIGNLSVDYLYKNDCSIEELSRYLSRLASAANVSEDEGNLVEKGTDFDCVQVMTIHASKGLEFPVVIAPAGFKGLNEQIPSVYLYHEPKLKMGFIKECKEKFRTDECYERERLFYVAYTRASSLLILPFYEQWKDSGIYAFLHKNIGNLIQQGEDQSPYYHKISYDPKKTNLKTAVQDILKKNKELAERSQNSQEKTESLRTEEEQIEYSRNLTKQVPGLLLRKHSYSTLSKSKSESDEMTENGGRYDKEGSVKKDQDLSRFDSSENPALADSDTGAASSDSSTTSILTIPANYPRGIKAGKAIHEVFEKIDFVRYGQTEEPDAVTKKDSLGKLITNCFTKQTIRIPEKSSDTWLLYTAQLLWHTLNAKFPEIAGSHKENNFFRLNEITFENRSSEAEFNMNSRLSTKTADYLKNYFNGFVDLVFKRKSGDKELYSVLDWKSDSFEASAYSNVSALKQHTDEAYSIQRVIYSYGLIKWLKNFYTDETESQIFENHFGGIYYVYVRGCKAGTSNGIYARTWKSWDELEKAFNNIMLDFQIAD